MLVLLHDLIQSITRVSAANCTSALRERVWKTASHKNWESIKSSDMIVAVRRDCSIRHLLL